MVLVAKSFKHFVKTKTLHSRTTCPKCKGYGEFETKYTARCVFTPCSNCQGGGFLYKEHKY